MKNLVKKTRHAFTLVELLIAIIILGALASTMMLSAGNSVAAAKANTIIANMVTVKDGAAMYYTGNPRTATADTFNTNNDVTKIYLGDFELNKIQGSATFTVEAGSDSGSNSRKWYVKAVINESDPDAQAIRDFLKKSASKSQLLKTRGSSATYDGGTNNTLYMQIK